MRKRLIFGLLSLFCLGMLGLIAFLWVTAPPHGITKEGFDKVRKGMTEKEVEDILGVPPGKYEPSTPKERIYPAFDLFIPAVPAQEKVWRGGGFVISVWFDEAGKVYYSQIRGESSETFFDKVRRSLRRMVLHRNHRAPVWA